MRLEITIMGDEKEATLSLYHWLMRDVDSGDAEISLEGRAASDSVPMSGASLDLINVVVSNTLALSSLVVAIANWRASRAQSHEVSLLFPAVATDSDSESSEDETGG
ncbi:effector-associated constant component EACC1 [Streptomyces sp. NPDC054787]